MGLFPEIYLSEDAMTPRVTFSLSPMNVRDICALLSGRTGIDRVLFINAANTEEISPREPSHSLEEARAICLANQDTLSTDRITNACMTWIRLSQSIYDIREVYQVCSGEPFLSLYARQEMFRRQAQFEKDKRRCRPR